MEDSSVMVLLSKFGILKVHNIIFIDIGLIIRVLDVDAWQYVEIIDIAEILTDGIHVGTVEFCIGSYFASFLNWCCLLLQNVVKYI